jgi:hypothetical protein
MPGGFGFTGVWHGSDARLTLQLARFCFISEHANNLQENLAVAMGCSPHRRFSWIRARSNVSRLRPEIRTRSPREISRPMALSRAAKVVSGGEHDLSGVGLNPIAQRRPMT